MILWAGEDPVMDMCQVLPDRRPEGVGLDVGANPCGVPTRASESSPIEGTNMSTRDTIIYHFYSLSGDLLHCGRTRRPLRFREREHRRRFGEPDGYAVKAGPKRSWKSAGEWERANRCSPYDD